MKMSPVTCTSMDQVRTACVHKVDGACVDVLHAYNYAKDIMIVEVYM